MVSQKKLQRSRIDAAGPCTAPKQETARFAFIRPFDPGPNSVD